jgi:hypothetical protein
MNIYKLICQNISLGFFFFFFFFFFFNELPLLKFIKENFFLIQIFLEFNLLDQAR